MFWQVEDVPSVPSVPDFQSIPGVPSIPCVPCFSNDRFLVLCWFKNMVPILTNAKYLISMYFLLRLCKKINIILDYKA